MNAMVGAPEEIDAAQTAKQVALGTLIARAFLGSGVMVGDPGDGNINGTISFEGNDPGTLGQRVALFLQKHDNQLTIRFLSGLEVQDRELKDALNKAGLINAPNEDGSFVIDLNDHEKAGNLSKLAAEYAILADIRRNVAAMSEHAGKTALLVKEAGFENATLTIRAQALGSYAQGLFEQARAGLFSQTGAYFEAGVTPTR